MPYRREGREVLVQRGGTWHLLKRHPTEEKAARHLRALHANVPVGHKLTKKKR